MTTLVLIETSSNQDWVFSSNRLRDVVGGSELLARSTTEWLFEALNELDANECRWSNDVTTRASTLLGDANLGANASVVMSTSGKALVIVSDPTLARKIISKLTKRAIEEAPGLDLRGVWVEAELSDPTAAAKAIGDVHRLLDRGRTQSTSTQLRGRRRPVIATCVATGGVANRRVTNSVSKREELLSDSSVARRKVVADARWRFDDIAGLRNDPTGTLAGSIEQFDDSANERDRLALVHIDTNGLGSVFADPNSLTLPGENPLDALRRFAVGVDVCASKAFNDALATLTRTLKNPWQLKLVPILSGGDDTTVICRGQDAFDFVGQYLGAFERHTAAHMDVGARRAEPGKPPVPLTSCAGVVWTKATYPLSLSMGLAVDLCREAKRAVAVANLPFSAWEFHDIHDSVAVTWQSVLDDLTIGGENELLCHRPVYVRGSDPRWSSPLPRDIEIRTHDALRGRVDCCMGAHERTSALTTAQLYSLREALFLGHDVADQQLGLVEERCGLQPGLYADDKSLYFGQTVRTTPLLDAMTIARNQV